MFSHEQLEVKRIESFLVVAEGHCSLGVIAELDRRWRCACCEHRGACDQTPNNRRGCIQDQATLTDCFIM